MPQGPRQRPTVAKAAERERLEQEARTELARLDVKPVDDPIRELQKLVGQVLAWKDAIGRMVNQLETIRYEDELGGEQLRSEVALFERAMDWCERVLGAMAWLNIDEQLVKFSEGQGRVIIQVMTAAFAELGLTRENTGRGSAGDRTAAAARCRARAEARAGTELSSGLLVRPVESQNARVVTASRPAQIRGGTRLRAAGSTPRRRAGR